MTLYLLAFGLTLTGLFLVWWYIHRTEMRAVYGSVWLPFFAVVLYLISNGWDINASQGPQAISPQFRLTVLGITQALLLWFGVLVGMRIFSTATAQVRNSKFWRMALSLVFTSGAFVGLQTYVAVLLPSVLSSLLAAPVVGFFSVPVLGVLVGNQKRQLASRSS